MILDKQNLFSDDQAITTSAASTNVIDLGADDSSVVTPNEKNAEILCQVTTAFANGTSIKVKIQTDSDENFGSATDLIETAAILTASLTQGYKFKLPWVAEGLERYVRLYYTVSGTMNAGKITAGIVLDKQTNA